MSSSPTPSTPIPASSWRRRGNVKGHARACPFLLGGDRQGIQQGRRSVSMEGERARCPAKRPRRQAGHGVKPGREWAKREGRKMPPGGRPANCEPSEAGRSWKGGAREQADDVFFCRRHKKTSEQSGLCSDVAPPARLERTTFRLGVRLQYVSRVASDTQKVLEILRFLILESL